MEDSKRLLQYAMNILDEASIEKNEWAVGGGTVLAHYYNHRMSKDIDIFINDIQYLSKVSPRFNDSADNLLDYEEDGNYISLAFPEGKVDFIAGSQISDYHPHNTEFLGQELYLEDPVEIVSKKMFYRGTYLKPRDLFDLAVVSHSDRHNDLVKTLNKISEQTDNFFIKYNKMKEKNIYSKESKDSILEGGIKFINNECYVIDKLGAELKAKRIIKGIGNVR